MLTCHMIRFLSLLLLGLCGGSPWFVCEVVVVPYVVSAMTVIHVLLFVLHVCVFCEGDSNAGVGSEGVLLR